MNRAERTVQVVHDLEIVVRRFEDEYRRTQNRHFGSKRNGHTELADGFAWGIAALRNAVELLPRASEYRKVLTGPDGLLARAEQIMDEVYSR